MNRGVLQNSPVQQMMAAANPSSWWNINTFIKPPPQPPLLSPHHHQPPPLLLSPPSSSSTSNFLPPQPNSSSTTTSTTTTTTTNNNNLNNNNNNNIDNDNNNNNLYEGNPYDMPHVPSSSSWLDDHNHHHQPHFPQSWSQLLMDGVCLEDDQDEAKKIETWENHQVAIPHHNHRSLAKVKQESSVGTSFTTNTINHVYTSQQVQDQEFNHHLNWSCHPQMINNNNNNLPVSSPQSCVTTFSGSNCNNMLDFSSSKSSDTLPHSNTKLLPKVDPSSQCNNYTTNGGALKKAKVQPSSTQPTFKVRKEKLGDRITALHQLVSPFGKTDTASVLLEAIGYVRFLQNQIEALSLPYLSGGARNKKQPHPVGGDRHCIFPEDPGQLLNNDNCLKRKGGPDKQDSCEEPKKDLRSRGLCLVPVSCTLQVGNENGADYWAPALGGGFR